MKTYTMVMRCCDEKTSMNDTTYMLIALDNYDIERRTGKEIVTAIKSKSIEVTNLGVENDSIVATNGDIKRYTTFKIDGTMVGTPSAVILNRVEGPNGIIGYTIFDVKGIIKEVTTIQAANLAKAGAIANGKIRHTENGDIVSSIRGNYPLRIIEISKVATRTAKIDVGMMFIGSALYKKSNIKYAGVFVKCDNAASLAALHSKLDAANKALIHEIFETTSVDEQQSLGMIRTSNAGFYGVYPLPVVMSLIEKAGNSINLVTGKLIIAATDYEDDRIESNVLINTDMKPEAKNSGNQKTDNALKEYTSYILEKFKTVKIV